MKNLKMKLINKELEKEFSSNKSDIREKLLEEQLEEMNKQLIIYMTLGILSIPHPPPESFRDTFKHSPFTIPLFYFSFVTHKLSYLCFGFDYLFVSFASVAQR